MKPGLVGAGGEDNRKEDMEAVLGGTSRLK